MKGGKKKKREKAKKENSINENGVAKFSTRRRNGEAVSARWRGH